MKSMWHCAFFTLTIIIIIWFFSYGFLKSEISGLNSNTEIEVSILENSVEKRSDLKNGDVFNNRGKKFKQHVPKVMLEFYENSKKNGEEKTPDIVKSIVPTHTGTPSSSYFIQEDSKNDHHLLVFNVPNSNEDEQFIKAELRVLTLIEIKSKIALGIERQIKISLYNETTNTLKFLEEKHIYHTENTWISFNVSKVVQKTLYASRHEKTLKFIITIKLYQQFKNIKTGIFKLSLMPITENFEHDYPVLLLFYSNAKSEIYHTFKNNNDNTSMVMRNKRNVEDDYEEESNRIWDDEINNNNKVLSKKLRRLRNNCRKRPLYIDFAEIQYDVWIVQPSGYEAYQCAGKCFYPVADHLSPTKHAIVQALLHSVAPSRAPRSCCVPTKLDAISVLYVDTQGVLTYRYAYKDMVVTQCGCR